MSRFTYFIKPCIFQFSCWYISGRAGWDPAELVSRLWNVNSSNEFPASKKAKKLVCTHYKAREDVYLVAYSEVCVRISFFKGRFFCIFLVLYLDLLHLPPLRFHSVGGCWDRTQDSCDFVCVCCNLQGTQSRQFQCKSPTGAKGAWYSEHLAWRDETSP